MKGVFVVDKGTWQSGYKWTDKEGAEHTGYRMGHLVHKTSGIYRSATDDNTADPDTDTTGKWTLWVDIKPVSNAVQNAKTAADNANAKAAVAETATANANTAAENANTEAGLAAGATADARDAISRLNAFMDAWSSQNPMSGFARTNGDSDPAAAVTYGVSQIREAGRHLRLATVKDGQVQHMAARGRLTLATNGDDIAIDGSEGDVMLMFDVPVHQLKATETVEGTETNCMGVGLVPVAWQGHYSKKYEPFAFTPWETVNCKLAGDVRTQAHCIYNTSAIGEYKTPIAFFEETVKTSGGGYPSQYVTGFQNYQYAQAKNADANTIDTYAASYYGFEEIIRTMMYAECQTLNVTALDIFGTGCTSQDIAGATTFWDDAVSANSGVKIITTGGAASYIALNAQLKTSSTAGGQMVIGGIAGSSWYGFTECGESVRTLDAIAKAGLTDCIGSKDNVFTYDGDGNMTVITDGSVDLATGAGMTAGKKYFVVRNVPNCEGMADGVMTAVVNIYLKLTAKAGVCNGSTDISGAACIFKFSHGVYRGWCIPMDGVFRHIGYFHHSIRKEGGKYYVSVWCADDVKDIQPLGGTSCYGVIGTAFPVLKGLQCKYRNLATGNGWVMKADYNASLFCYLATGAGSHSHEVCHVWRSNCYGVGTNNLPAEGYEAVNASVAGCPASYAHASARTLVANHALSYRDDHCAGAFAVPALRLA